jgi:ATP-dependent DNA helicase DinG
MTPTTFAEAQEALAENLPGYTRRTHQMALAEQVETAIADRKPALFQAGTGTGKSMALLIPAILSGLDTVVATFNKALQSQYALKDLPWLQEHLGVDFTWAVLKGRANYPCYAKVPEVTSPTNGQAAVLDRMAELDTPEAVKNLDITDREDFPSLPEDEWRVFSMSSAECPGAASCPFGEKCITERAKARAAEAQIVITNTAYLLQDLMLRSATDGNVALLGDIEQLIIDEAHTLPDVATSALEDTLGEGSFAKLARDMGGYLFRQGGDEEVAIQLEQAARDLWEQLGAMHAEFLARLKGKVEPLPLNPNTLISSDALGPYIIRLYQAIELVRDEVKAHPADDDSGRIARSRLLRRSSNQMARLEAYATDPADKTVRWIEQENSTFRGQERKRLYLRSAPVSVAPFLRTALWDKMPAILSSATLAAGKDFSYLADSLGLGRDEAMTYDAGSPFDYPRQVLMFIPDKNAPDPSKNPAAWKSYAQAVSYDLVDAAAGGAMLLFTSRTAMNESHQALAARFRRNGLTVLRQGDAPNSELIRAFKADGNAVLFGLRTFFEGVDIQGQALRLVVLDKLPFAVPTDLVYQAREEAIKRRYHDEWAGFTRLAIPSMILVLTQAFGRLIRHRDDKGVVAILDNRLETKRYGKQIISALPPAQRTSDMGGVVRFLKNAR